MTDDTLRELFAEAFHDEPDRMASPDEDIARGRASRTRQRRTRLTTGVVAVVAAASLGVVAPDAIDDLRAPSVDTAAPSYDELPAFEPAVIEAQAASLESTGELQSGGEPGGRTFAAEPADMVAALRAALPADLTFPGAPSAQQSVGRHRVVFFAERDGVPFTLRVWWQPGSEMATEFRPCTEPAAAFTRTAVWDDCTQGNDERARWRVAGSPDAQHRVLVVDGAPASATVVWETTGDAAAAPSDLFSDDEAYHLADVAWDVAVNSVALFSGTGTSAFTELNTDFEIGAVAASWASVEAALTSVLGPLTRIRLDEPDVDRLANWMVNPPEPKVVTASYRTATGATVELAVWQAGPVYGTLCTNLIVCEVWAGSREYFTPLLTSSADAMGGTALGDQGQAYLVLDGVSGDVVTLHRAAMEALFSVLPDPG